MTDNEAPVRIRKRCVWCDPPHLMDGLGDVGPGDELRDSFCPKAQAKALGYIDELGEKERQALEGQLYTPHDVAGIISALSAEVEEGQRFRFSDLFRLEGPPPVVVLWWIWFAFVSAGACLAIWRLF